MALFRRKSLPPEPPLPPAYDSVADDDRQVLIQMVAMGADLTQPRHVLHYLYVPTSDAAEDAAGSAREVGWEVQVQPSAADDGTWCVLAQQHGYILSPHTVNADRALFDGLALTHAGEYDGWEASLA